MSFALFIIGAALLISAVKNTQGDLFALVKGDFTGQNNFIFWMTAILIIGAVAYIPKFKAFGNALLALVIVVLVLTKGDPSKTGGGFFSQFAKTLNSTTNTPAATASTGTSTGGLSSLLPALPALPTLLSLGA